MVLRLLAGDRSAATRELLGEYAPHAAWLAGLRGRIIDIGGAGGLAARFLAPEADYVVVDPAEVWTTPAWREFAASFFNGAPDPQMVKGEGEQLPFGDATFDAALALWSFNHFRDPSRCIAEMRRVLRSGGTALIVLEDLELRWRELSAALIGKVRGRWPVQPAISESTSAS